MRLTPEQRAFVDHLPEAFVVACPGAGKTQTIVERVGRIASKLPPRRGIAILSFTNTAIETFISRCHVAGLGDALLHPGFIGTFDAFLRHFFFASGGVDGIAIRPTVVDSWKTLGVDVRLPGLMAFRGQGVSLDRFDPETNQIDPDSIGHNGQRAHVRTHQSAYEQAAAKRRNALRRKAYLSSEDVRVDVSNRLQHKEWANALGRALARRFEEIIVDEAQDCNPLDCQIIHWLRDQGIAVTVIGDPDQSIYGFRNGGLDGLRGIGEKYDVSNRLVLTGNFRSSPPVCSLAATLRSRSTPDVSTGDSSAISEMVHVLSYSSPSVSDAIGRRFCELITAAGIPKANGIVLAHSRRIALKACGSDIEDERSNSHVARIASAVGAFWSPFVSNRIRESALQKVEWTLLDLMGQLDEGEIPSRATERLGINPRWLRRSALQLISHLPRTCADTSSARTSWITTLRERVQSLNLSYRVGISVNQYFQNRTDANWNRFLVSESVPDIRSSTVHEAKGKEYDAVCIVIPPDRANSSRTDQLFTCWQNRTDDEAKRVIYVGVTRAMKLVAIGIPATFKNRLITILQPIQDITRFHDL